MSILLQPVRGQGTGGIDVEPPLPPAGGMLDDETGTVSWTANSEPDIRDYRIYRSTVISNCIFIEGATKLYISHGAAGEPASYNRRAYLHGNEFYDQLLGSAVTGPFTAMSNENPVTAAEAVNNTHYSDDETGSTMDQGSTPWVTFTNNRRLPYQGPPARTQGASH